jgi:hypothetical protein
VLRLYPPVLDGRDAGDHQRKFFFRSRHIGQYYGRVQGGAGSNSPSPGRNTKKKTKKIRKREKKKTEQRARRQKWTRKKKKKKKKKKKSSTAHARRIEPTEEHAVCKERPCRREPLAKAIARRDARHAPKPVRARVAHREAHPLFPPMRRLCHFSIFFIFFFS